MQVSFFYESINFYIVYKNELLLKIYNISYIMIIQQ